MRSRTGGRCGGAAVTAAVAFAFVVAVAPVAAQSHEAHGERGHAMAMPEAGLRAELIRDVEQLESKYLRLAEAMAAHWSWSPGEGVRSVGAVFGHIAAASFMIPEMAGVMPPMAYRGDEGRSAMRALESSASYEALLPELRHSFMHARHALARVDDAELDAPTRLFGREATKRQVLTLLVAHMHEHLGQAIAYARTNGVTPPWSDSGE